MLVETEDRRKAEFLTGYRELCKKHGLLVLLTESDDGQTVFVLAEYCDWAMDTVVQEVLMEPIRFIRKTG